MITDRLKELWFTALYNNSYNDIEKLLYANEELINIKDGNGFTAIIKIAISNRTTPADIVDLLINHPKIKVNEKSGTFSHDTALIWAAYCNHTYIATQLLKHPDIDPNIPQIDGYTPLMFAAGKIIIKSLLEHPKTNLLIKKKGDIFLQKESLSPNYESYDIQKLIIDSEPSLIKYFIEKPIPIHPDIQKEFSHLINASELNLL